MLIRAIRELFAEDAQLAGHHVCVDFAKLYFL
jgi:hypothetical protein